MARTSVTSLHPTRANEVIALLGSMGIEADFQKNDTHQTELLVDDRDLRRVRQLLVEEYAGDLLQTPILVRQTPAEPAGPFNLTVLVYLFLLEGLNFFRLYNANPKPRRSDFLDNGALTWERIDQGEFWRLTTAVFVHFDFVHLAANLLTLTLIGPLVTRAFGGFRFLVIFLLSGVGGNIASHVLSPSGALKAGASGGVAGVLGACAGHAIANRHQSRYRAWQMVGGVIGAYALLIGAGPRSDHIAHAGGLVAGFVLGWLLAPATPEAEAPTSGQFRGPGHSVDVAAPPSVIDHNIDSAPKADATIDGCFNIALPRHVGDQKFDFHANLIANFGSNDTTACGIFFGQPDARTLPCETTRDSSADAVAGTPHNRRLTFQLTHLRASNLSDVPPVVSNQ